ncbi:hypothetical protein SEA_BAUER_80 [Arthrobacter phage Bauer]|uniref:DUF3310 domain-containing protein n=1 Tax=Arthrobacter phage Bauer TaxID=2985648 RepID=A0A9E8ADC2_9CAUD|nr:hypothetical protein QEO99_gp80 [Arthrobacter phage Bauer]UYM26629.1 hypothetical protein SEA_BAUER_80 [Arthrobacter phage Bauer]
MKFKIGDHVRIIGRGSRYFDKVGTVSEATTSPLPFGIVGLDDDFGTVWFGEHELILAEAPEHPPADDAVNHPPHYGGEDDPYEAIKVIEAWGLGFHLGNTVKYIARAGKKSGQSLLQDLRKARWYIDRLIKKLEGEQ